MAFLPKYRKCFRVSVLQTVAPAWVPQEVSGEFSSVGCCYVTSCVVQWLETAVVYDVGSAVWGICQFLLVSQEGQIG